MLDELFRWVPIFIGVVVVIIALVIVVKVGTARGEWISNSLKPVRRGRARITGKRTHVSGGGQYGSARTT